MIYLHKSAGRERVTADALSKMIEDARRDKDPDEDEDPDDGAAGVLVPA